MIHKKRFEVLVILSNTRILLIMQIIIKLVLSFLIIFYEIYLHVFLKINISKDSSHECYQSNKERLQKKLMKDIKVLLKKKKKKSDNSVGNNKTISQKMKNMCLLSI